MSCVSKGLSSSSRTGNSTKVLLMTLDANRGGIPQDHTPLTSDVRRSIIRAMAQASQGSGSKEISLEYERDLRRQTLSRILRMRELYLIFLVPLVLVIIFRYVSMAGVMIAFKNYRPVKDILGSDWNNFDHFKFFWLSPDLWGNTYYPNSAMTWRRKFSNTR